MKKNGLFFVILSFLVFSVVGVSHGWQGRMGGMGDPYGLVEDESDFLIHPPEIIIGEGIKFYGNYRFTYRDIKDWNYTLSLFDSATGTLSTNFPFEGLGDENEHDALLGAAFPLGQGRMGLFFQYAYKRGDFDGENNEVRPLFRGYHRYSLDSDLDTFALRVLYGHPMGGFKLGGEIDLAYRREENEIFFDEDYGGGTRFFYTNYPFGFLTRTINLFPFMFPYDSKYWEALFKGSLSGALGAGKFAFTVRGGFIFTGDNKLEHRRDAFFGSGAIDMDGDVKGWRVGGDLWLRYPLREYLSLPVLLKVDYWEKTRDGDAVGTGAFYGGRSYDYENRKRIFQVEAGGGLDRVLNKGTRIAAGIYYGYMENKNDFVLNELAPGFFFAIYDHSKYPDNREHRVILRLAGENEVTPQITIRMGLSFFYGWLKEDFRLNYTTNYTFGSERGEEKVSLDGHHSGIGASMGATIKVWRVIIEPFIGGAYQKLDIDGDGFFITPIASAAPLEMDKLRKDWSIGGGLSIKF